VTFKLPEDQWIGTEFDLKSTFARSYGFCLGKVTGQLAESVAEKVWHLAGDLRPTHLHVWQRDIDLPGSSGFEPGISLLAEEIGNCIAGKALHVSENVRLRLNETARPKSLVIDCVIVEPSEWWLGWHLALTVPQRWPGGICPVRLPDHVISRAYLKMTEGIEWSRLPIRAGDWCVEIGCAPGGSCQVLLERGLKVMGIDPAEVDPTILGHPNFTHVQKRGRDLKRREFRGYRWLVCDSNVTPTQTLDTIEDIVTHEDVHIRGLLITLKLANWDLAEAIPAYLDRIRGWGYQYVRARQLSFGRREICVAAMRSRSVRREGTHRRVRKKARS
jgi:23S rRNA (cytidine2498-2'-O)-methyltransferase